MFLRCLCPELMVLKFEGGRGRLYTSNLALAAASEPEDRRAKSNLSCKLTA